MNKKIMKKAIISILLLVAGAIIGISWKANIDAKKRCENKEINNSLITQTEPIQTSNAITDNKQLPIPVENNVPDISPLNILKQYETGIVNLFERSSSSVVYITTTTYQRDYLSRNIYEIPSGTGSGFVWDEDGHIITNYHVVKNAKKIEVTLSNHTSWEAELIGSSPSKDIAVLKINISKDKLNTIDKGSSSNLRVGEFVMAIGNPFGLDQTLTTGVISALGREIESQAQIPIRDIIQIDAAINPGNSGGPLLNSSGQLIGVNTAIYSPSGASAGIGFAIPVDVVKWVVSDLITYGEIRRPVLGIGMIPDNYAKAYGVETGAVISYIYPKSPAEKAELKGTTKSKLGDIIIGINNEKISNNTDLILALEKFKPGEKITLTILREQKEVAVDLVLGSSN